MFWKSSFVRFLSDFFSGYLEMLVKARQRLISQIDEVRELALGGTAVGTGLNSFVIFDEKFCT